MHERCTFILHHSEEIRSSHHPRCCRSNQAIRFATLERQSFPCIENINFLPSTISANYVYLTFLVEVIRLPIAHLSMVILFKELAVSSSFSQQRYPSGLCARAVDTVRQLHVHTKPHQHISCCNVALQVSGHMFSHSCQ